MLVEMSVNKDADQYVNPGRRGLNDEDFASPPRERERPPTSVISVSSDERTHILQQRVLVLTSMGQLSQQIFRAVLPLFFFFFPAYIFQRTMYTLNEIASSSVRSNLRVIQH